MEGIVKVEEVIQSDGIHVCCWFFMYRWFRMWCSGQVNLYNGSEWLVVVHCTMAVVLNNMCTSMSVQKKIHWYEIAMAVVSVEIWSSDLRGHEKRLNQCKWLSKMGKKITSSKEVNWLMLNSGLLICKIQLKMEVYTTYVIVVLHSHW